MCASELQYCMGQMRNIIVVPYDPHWPEFYLHEAAQLRNAFDGFLVSIHHIGSTSIPGMAAKPVIDIMPVVRSLAQVDAMTPVMIRLGYQPKGESGITGRRYFVKGSDELRTHHVHVYKPDHPEVARHLDLRDYLRAHAGEAERYARLKVELARQFPQEIDRYMAGKDGMIKDIIRRAAEWRAERAGAAADNMTRVS